MSKKSARKHSRKHSRTKKAFESLEHRTLLASPLVITKGGTYTGTFESSDRKTPAVVVKTSEPVIIENATVRGPGDLIKSGVDHTNITVRNVKGYGLNPNVYGETDGEFISVERFDNLIVEHTYNEHTTGINLLNYMGDRTPNETVKIVDNVVHNVDGRKSDGNGGYLTFNTRTNKATGQSEDGYEYAQFVQFDKVLSVPGIEIAWNEVINEPGNSRVEDNISLYKSSGTAASPILIHDNYVQGAYTVDPGKGDYSDDQYDYDNGFSGGGIMLGDGVGSTSSDDPAYVKAYGNTVVSTTNYGIAISAGHDMEYYDNRVISAGVLPDGTKISQQNTGMYVWDSYHAGSSHFYNDSAHDNVAGWMKGTSRNDWWTNVSSLMPNNTHMSGSITTATESAEHSAWKTRWLDHGDVNEGGGGGGDTVGGGGGGDTVGGGGGGDTVGGGGGGDTVGGGGGGDTVGGGGGGDTVTGGGGGDTVGGGGGGDTVGGGGGGDTVGGGGGGDTVGGGGGGDTVGGGGGGDTVTGGGGGDTVGGGGSGDGTGSGTGGDDDGDGGLDLPSPDDPPALPPVDQDITPIDFSGVVYNDRDGDGHRDNGEAGIAGRTVFADADHDGVFDPGEESAVTTRTGRYNLSLKPGDYTLREVVPAGSYATAGANGRLIEVSENGVDGDTSFGVTKYARISGTVKRDSNHNHRRDAADKPITGATVFIDKNNNGWIDAGERTFKTGADGKWSFTNLKPGMYIIRIRPNDKSLTRLSPSYFKHRLLGGSNYANDNFSYS